MKHSDQVCSLELAKKLKEYNVQVILDYGVEGGDESAAARVGACELVVEMREQGGGRFVCAGLGVGDGVGDGHEDGGGRAVAGDVGDEQAPAVFWIGQREEVVIVAAGPRAGAVIRGHFEPVDLRKLLR